MGRSVSVPSDSVCTVFLDDPAGLLETLDDDYSWAWDEFITGLVDLVTARYPSLRQSDRWLGREERIIAENDHGLVVVCEYCGAVSVSLVPRPFNYDDPSLDALRRAWCDRVADGFRKLIEESYPGSAMRRVGMMSNGCGVYQRVDA